MKITWLGHDAFLFETAQGPIIMSDPYEAGSYDGAVGYEPIQEKADIVFKTHDHADHGAIENLPGPPLAISGAGAHDAQGITFKGVATYHDKTKGSERGSNTVFVFEVDGMKICHLGDLGHELSAEQVAEIGPIDVLLVPVGGYFTIDHAEAWRVAQSLRPKVVIPIHYKTDKLGFPLDTVEVFLQGKDNVEYIEDSSFELDSDSLPEEMKILVVKEHKL